MMKINKSETSIDILGRNSAKFSYTFITGIIGKTNLTIYPKLESCQINK